MLNPMCNLASHPKADELAWAEAAFDPSDVTHVVGTMSSEALGFADADFTEHVPGPAPAAKRHKKDKPVLEDRRIVEFDKPCDACGYG